VQGLPRNILALGLGGRTQQDAQPGHLRLADSGASRRAKSHELVWQGGGQVVEHRKQPPSQLGEALAQIFIPRRAGLPAKPLSRPTTALLNGTVQHQRPQPCPAHGVRPILRTADLPAEGVNHGEHSLTASFGGLPVV